MARARNIKPGLFKNEVLGIADPLITLLFENLWCLADREGRLEDRPLRIKAETFPYRENIDVNGYLTELQRMKFICRYTVSGEHYIQVLNFHKHQNPHKTEKASTIPEMPYESDGCALTVVVPLNNGPRPADSLVLIPDSLFTDSGIPVEAPKNRKRKPDATATRLPADWLPSDGDKEFCKTERRDLAVDAVAARFRDYWHSIPGAKGRKLDWNGTWRNWVRNERRVSNGPPDKFDPTAYVNRNRNNP